MASIIGQRMLIAGRRVHPNVITSRSTFKSVSSTSVSNFFSSTTTLDMGEDAYENPDEAPKLFSRPKPMEVANSIASAVKNDKSSLENRHTLAVLVDNESGVLSRISGLLSARGFNIDSLTVSPTNIPDLSRMTIVIKDVPLGKAAQAMKQLSDVVNVWAVVDYTGSNSLQREVVMVKVSYMPASGSYRADASTNSKPGYQQLLAAQGHRAAVRDIGQLFNAEVVDVGSKHIVFQLTSWSRRIDAFLRILEPWGVIEVARSGVVAMLRSPVAGSMTDQIRMPKEGTPDASQLPPG